MNARTLIAAAIALAATIPPPANAGQAHPDLTGTWNGIIKCKSVVGGVKDKFTLTPTMLITQGGLEVAIRLDYGGGDVENYSALTNSDIKKPLQKAELAVIACTTNDILGDEPDYDEVGRISVSTKDFGVVNGTFKGTSIFSDPGTFPAEVGTCKWKYKRVDLTDANIALFCGTPPPP